MGDAPIIKQIAEARDYDELVAGLRARVEALGTTHGSIDEVSGLQAGYTGKLLGPGAVRSFGRTSLGPMLGALGLKIVLVEDSESAARITSRLKKRQRHSRVHSQASMAAQALALTGKTKRALMTKIKQELIKPWASKGGKARADKLSPARRAAIASKAARARWSKTCFSG